MNFHVSAFARLISYCNIRWKFLIIFAINRIGPVVHNEGNGVTSISLHSIQCYNSCSMCPRFRSGRMPFIAEVSVSDLNIYNCRDRDKSIISSKVFIELCLQRTPSTTDRLDVLVQNVAKAS